MLFPHFVGKSKNLFKSKKHIASGFITLPAGVPVLLNDTFTDWSNRFFLPTYKLNWVPDGLGYGKIAFYVENNSLYAYSHLDSEIAYGIDTFLLNTKVHHTFQTVSDGNFQATINLPTEFQSTDNFVYFTDSHSYTGLSWAYANSYFEWGSDGGAIQALIKRAYNSTSYQWSVGCQVIDLASLQ